MLTKRSTGRRCDDEPRKRRGLALAISLVVTSLCAAMLTTVAAQPASASAPHIVFSVGGNYNYDLNGKHYSVPCLFQFTHELRWSDEYEMRLEARVGCQRVKLSGGHILLTVHKTDTTEQQTIESSVERTFSEGGFNWVEMDKDFGFRTCKYGQYYGFWGDAAAKYLKTYDPLTGRSGQFSWNPAMASNEIRGVGNYFRGCHSA